VVFLVAIVDAARKIIILDYKTVTSDMLYSIFAVIVSLGFGFFLVRRSLSAKELQQPKESGS
jgi:uncharacterized membrane protein (DUF373 family)